MNPREALKIELLWQRHAFCEGQRAIPHDCRGGLELHEALLKRNDAVSRAEKAYLVNEINVALLCSQFHQKYGQATWLSRFLAERQVARYGREAVEGYLDGFPGKVKISLAALLAGPGIPKDLLAKAAEGYE
jgi:hypothetical protein